MTEHKIPGNSNIKATKKQTEVFIIQTMCRQKTKQNKQTTTNKRQCERIIS